MKRIKQIGLAAFLTLTAVFMLPQAQAAVRSDMEAVSGDLHFLRAARRTGYGWLRRRQDGRGLFRLPAQVGRQATARRM